MNATHDQIAAARKALGGYDGPTGLDPLLRRCREQEICYELGCPVKQIRIRVWRRDPDNVYPPLEQRYSQDAADELTALILALAAMGEKENGNG